MWCMKVRRYQCFVGRFWKLRQLVGLGGVRSDLLLAQFSYGGAECLMLLAGPVQVSESAPVPSLFGGAPQTVCSNGSQSSGKSGGLSTELSTSTKARDSTDSAIAIIVSRTWNPSAPWARCGLPSRMARAISRTPVPRAAD